MISTIANPGNSNTRTCLHLLIAFPTCGRSNHIPELDLSCNQRRDDQVVTRNVYLEWLINLMRSLKFPPNAF